MTIKELTAQLKKRGLDQTGKKAELTARLTEAIKAEDEEIAPKEIKVDTERLTFRYGTKTAGVINYVTNLLTKDSKAKLLIFSQFGSFLDRITRLLDSYDIPSVTVGGNVHLRNNALAAFKAKDSKVRVLMLSSDNAASGTNLMEATHVLLLESVAGSVNEARAIEDQAIGRAYRQGQSQHVSVVRFLIRNTVEHEMYLEQAAPTESKDDKKVETRGSTPKVFRSKSSSTLLANAPLSKSSSSVLEDKMEVEEDQNDLS